MMLKRALNLALRNQSKGLVPSLGFSFDFGTIVPRAGGNGVPTFTRATTRTVIDFEGTVRNILSGEVPFYGLRRVRNLVTNSEGDGSWRVKTNVTTAPVSSDAPPGAATCVRVTVTNGASWSAQKTTANGTGVRQASIYVKGEGASIGRTIQFGQLDNGGAGSGVFVVVTLTSGWQRLASAQLAVTLGTDTAINVTTASSGTPVATNDTFLISAFQAEYVTGQSNQSPSEYVSVGVLSAPYHGAGVDGVKYFRTLNGNTVASNVVTEATGETLALDGSLPEQVIPVMGYFPEPASTNLVLQSENFASATWNKTGTPVITSGADRCGTVVLDLINDDDAAAFETLDQNVTFTGDAVKALSFFYKQGTAAQSNVYLYDVTAATARLQAVITWAGAVPTLAISGGIGTVLGNDELGNGVWRARLATASVVAANTNSLIIYPAGDAAGSVGTIYMGGVQAENATTCSSYIPTTTATVTRNADVMSTPTGAWFNAAAGTVVASVMSGPSPGFSHFIASLNDTTGNETIELYRASGTNGGWFINDGGVSQVNLVGALLAAGTAGKLAACYKLNDFENYVDGVRTGTGDQTGSIPTVTTLNIGHARNGVQFQGGIRTLDYYPERLSNLQLQALTI